MDHTGSLCPPPHEGRPAVTSRPSSNRLCDLRQQVPGAWGAESCRRGHASQQPAPGESGEGCGATRGGVGDPTVLQGPSWDTAVEGASPGPVLALLIHAG